MTLTETSEGTLDADARKRDVRLCAVDIDAECSPTAGRLFDITSIQLVYDNGFVFSSAP